MTRNYPVRHNLTTAPVVLTDATLVSAGGGEYTVSDATRVLKAGDSMTGDLTIGSGKNLKLTGGAGAGQGCIVFGAAASTFWDSNVCIVDSSAKTMGYVCGTTAAFTGTSGPFFGLRGNTFTAQPTQRGNIFLFGGKPSTPGATEGRVIFGTNDTERMYITYAGLVVMANATISDLPAGRVVVTTTGGRCASDTGLTWASSTLGVTQLQVGGGTALTKAAVYTPTLTPAATVGAGYHEQTFTVTGLATSDTVTVNGPAAAANTVLVHARVSAADTLALTWITSAAATPASGVYRVLAVRS